MNDISYVTIKMHREQIKCVMTEGIAKISGKQYQPLEEPTRKSYTINEILNDLYGSIAGIVIKESPFLTHQVDRGPIKIHRKKRIAKKWLKRYGRKIDIIPNKEIWMVGNYALCHPDVAKKLRREISEQWNANKRMNGDKDHAV